MSDTLDDILSLQKIEEGKFELEMKPMSVRVILSKLHSVFKCGLSAKKAFLEIAISSRVPAIMMGDACRLEHVIANLVSNAIKFSPSGSTITVKVEIEIPDLENGTPMMMGIAISDQGCGLSFEDQSRLFGNFVQINANGLQHGKGSGLGLSFCKKIVELHDGTIGVRSALGGGSTFFFEIPLIMCTIEQSIELSVMTTQECSSSHAIIKDTVSHNSGNDDVFGILVVDDFTSNRKMLGLLLSKEGVLDIGYAENGAEAVNMALENPNRFKLILMDNLMPEVKTTTHQISSTWA